MAEIRLTALASTVDRSANLASHYLLVDDGTTASKMSLLNLYPVRSNIGSGVAVLKEIVNGSLNTRTLVSANNLLNVAVNGSDEVEFTVSTSNIQSLITAYNYLTAVNLDTNLSGGTLGVANGGTNLTTLTDKSIVGTQLSGTKGFVEYSMNTNGGLLIGGTSGPTVSTLTAGSNISITNSDRSITINSTVPSTVVQENDNVTLGDVVVGNISVDSFSANNPASAVQTTSLATTVTVNAIAGTITLFEAAITADSNTQFTVVNSEVTATSVVFLSKEFESTVAANNGVHVSVASVSNGNFVINVTHTGNQNAAAIVRKIHFFVFG